MLIQIIDPQHRDYGSVVARTRTTEDARFIEYRDGGVWSRLHVSQFREIVEDEEGRPCERS